MYSLPLESRERDEAAAYEVRTRRLHDQLMASDAATCDNLLRLAERMTDLLPCDGICA